MSSVIEKAETYSASWRRYWRWYIASLCMFVGNAPSDPDPPTMSFTQLGAR
jgi:hypothetical protein